jgi:hypothetical protein
MESGARCQNATESGRQLQTGSSSLAFLQNRSPGLRITEFARNAAIEEDGIGEKSSKANAS